uniref:Transcription factor IIIA n=1 Tax=Echeneis naucrates TaxID=173247 RepID=A0A665UUD0_ECHNA
MGERLHSEKTYVCSYFDCKAAFSKSWKLEAHLCKHTGLKPFCCENCDKSFCTRYQLTRHELTAVLLFKTILTSEMCLADGCSEDFHKKKQLKAHKCEHQQGLPFHCSFSGCMKEFPSRGKLKHHEKVHEGYACEAEVCPFLGKTWTEYLKHRKEHKVKVPCGQCKRQFNNAWFLHQHELRVHSGERKMLLCPQQGCDKKFTRRFNLESHVLGDHEGKKCFSCAYPGCSKQFAMKESLWRHGVVHDPAKKKLKVFCLT